MVTRIRKGVRGHLYITEWRDSFGLTGEQLADRLDVSRETIWRWEKEQHRLDPGKIAALADALGIEPEQFWRLPGPPNRPSVDAMLAKTTDEQRAMVVDIVRRLVGGSER
jgi:transcriptional regulator with XRE-family HTH domain